MAPDNDIENRFANAVKLALDAPHADVPSAEMAADPAQVRAHPWRIALLYTALTATVAIIVAALLR